jgi:uncharacterized membrane protein SpoIIM required for sporulation
MSAERSRWLLARRAQWLALEAAERGVRRAGLSLEQADALAHGYRTLGGDVTASRSFMPHSALLRQLEALYRRLHERLYRPYEPWTLRLRRLYRDEVPAAMRRTLPQLQAVLTLFLLTALAGAYLVWAYPELAALFASEEMIAGAQRGELWTDDILGVTPASVLSASIAANNITVTLAAWALGVFYGLGTLYIIGLNGLMLGGVFAFVTRHGLGGELLRFISAHGPAELSIICLAGAAGLRLGEALARPGQRTRTQSFRDAVHDSGRLMFVGVPALMVCGWIEGHVSPDRAIATGTRVAIGLAAFASLWLALFGVPRAPRVRRVRRVRRVG